MVTQYNMLYHKQRLRLTTLQRLILTDERWQTLSRLMYQNVRIYNKAEHQMTLEGFFVSNSNRLLRLSITALGIGLCC
ncbi:hypothetical protein [Methylophaga nitratireducenticrescens]|nr:hypothetical protein [Methylophaga nitratireducenticrescens]